MLSYWCIWLLFVNILVDGQPMRIPLKPSTNSLNLTLRKRHLYREPLAYAGEETFVGKIEVGTPPQPLTVLFDTGVDVVMVPLITMPTTRYYDFEGSETSQHHECDLQLTYVTGILNCTVFSDTLKIDGLTLPEFTFAAATDVESPIRGSGLYFEGIFGLGYSALRSELPETFLDVMKRQLRDQKRIFSFWYCPKVGDQPARGELIIGELLQEYSEEELHCEPILPGDHWAVGLKKIQLGAVQQRFRNPATALLDTGAETISGPEEVIDRLHQQINYDRKDNGVYYVSCTAAQANHVLQLDFIGKGVRIPMSRLVLRRQNGVDCVSALTVLDGSDNHWILGGVFLQSFFTVFDRDNDVFCFGKAACPGASV